MSRTEIPEPTPNPNERIKKWSIDLLVKHEGEWCFERTHHVRRFDMVLRKWIEDKSKVTVEYVSLESQGIKKSHTLDVLILKEGQDEFLDPKFIYIKRTLQITVPNSPEFTNQYLKVNKGHKTKRKWVRGCFVLSDLALGTAQILNWQHPWIKPIGKREIVDDEEAQRMIDNAEVADLVSLKKGKISERRVVFNKVL